MLCFLVSFRGPGVGRLWLLLPWESQGPHISVALMLVLKHLL